MASASGPPSAVQGAILDVSGGPESLVGAVGWQGANDAADLEPSRRGRTQPYDRVDVDVRRIFEFKERYNLRAVRA
jgi:hypothetical protein